MKTMMLLNPRRKRKARKSSAARKPSIRRRRRKATASAPRRVKRTVRRRRSSRVVARRSGGGKLTGYKVGNVRVLTNPRRRRFGGGGGGGALIPGLSFLTKDDLWLAGGAVGGSIMAQTIIAKFGDKLPGLSEPAVVAGKPNMTHVLAKFGYSVGIPLLAAAAAQKISPKLAKGLVLGGLVDGITILVSNFLPSVTSGITGTSAYLDYMPRPVGSLAPSYQGINQFGNVRPVNGALDNGGAFPADAWTVTN